MPMQPGIYLYNMSIPLDQKFHTIAANVATKERGSALVNSQKEIFTMQDVANTVRPYKVFTATNINYAGETLNSFSILEDTLNCEFDFSQPNYLVVRLIDYISTGITNDKLYISSQYTFAGSCIFQANLEESPLMSGQIVFNCTTLDGLSEIIPLDLGNLEIRVYN
jgi:hypothetical protein